MSLFEIEYDKINDIKIYKGTTDEMRKKYLYNIDYLQKLVDDKIFTELYPSTLTAQGYMTNISFDESILINLLSEPTGLILMIGCNFGEKFNANYVIPTITKKSGRGRKPKPKIKNKRRSQGTGKYFSSQITFLIRHATTNIIYKIKLFRNGVFQVPGVKDPSMSDLIEPINALKEYLSLNFGKDVQIMNFMAVMRNYKARLINENLHVDLEKLEECINKEKNYSLFNPYIKYILKNIPNNIQKNMLKFIGKTNPLNVAEVSYNTDRCFCLILKFYRPMPCDKIKKTTVKLLKKGKINFDGGNSEYEIKELYHWLEYIYSKYKNQILIDITDIKNIYHKEFYKIDNSILYTLTDSDANLISSDANLISNNKNLISSDANLISSSNKSTIDSDTD
jgi:hypothetical protein